MIRRLRRRIRQIFPFLLPVWRRIKYVALAKQSPAESFTGIFRDNEWGSDQSLSGPGSDLEQTEAVRAALPGLLKTLECRSMLDVPCGDFHWMQHVELNLSYIGGDIVAELTAANQQRFGSGSRRFVTLDLITDTLPRADIVFCRDCLVHLSNAHVHAALQNIKRSGATYLLTTTFTARTRNTDIPTGAWRALNLQLPPFGLPAPIQLVDEHCPLPDYRDKHLGLWKLDEIELG